MLRINNVYRQQNTKLIMAQHEEESKGALGWCSRLLRRLYLAFSLLPTPQLPSRLSAQIRRPPSPRACGFSGARKGSKSLHRHLVSDSKFWSRQACRIDRCRSYQLCCLSCQQRLISPVGANVLGRLSMAGFEVITYGRFWVIAEGPKRRAGEVELKFAVNFDTPEPMQSQPSSASSTRFIQLPTAG